MNIQKIQQFIHLIGAGRTGSPQIIAVRLNISERMVYKYVCILKNELNVPIGYNKFNKTYFFSEKGQLVWSWIKKK